MAMIDALRNTFTKDHVMLGERKAEVQKLSYVKYRKISAVAEKLPGVIFSLTVIPPDDYYQAALYAFNMVAEEIYDVVAVLSDIDVEYLREHAGVTEIIDYLVLTYKRNNFAETIKNVRSLLPEETTNSPQEASRKA